MARPISGAMSITITITMMGGTASIQRTASTSTRIINQSMSSISAATKCATVTAIPTLVHNTNTADARTDPTDPSDLNNAQVVAKIRAWAFLCLLHGRPVRVRTRDGIHLGTDLGK